MARIALPGRPRAASALALALSILLPHTSLLAAAAADCIETTAHAVVEGGTNGLDAVAAADLDGDGDTDLLSASANDDTIAWFESDGGTPPAFTRRIITTQADGASALAVFDLDLDGRLDVVSASANDDTIAWYENVGEAPVRFIEREIFAGAGNASAVFVVDVDGDGDGDILFASAGDNTIEWLENGCQATGEAGACLGAPGFVLRTAISTSALGVASVFAADLDGNGRPDILAASRLDDTVAWYEQELSASAIPARSFIKHALSVSADGATSVFAADLNGDGHLDVISAAASEDEIDWYESDGADPPTFTKRIVSTSADGVASVFAVDLDGDDDTDLLSASPNDGKIAWYESDGASPPSFTEHVIATAGGARSVLAAHVNPGAALDVVTGSSVPGPIASSDLLAWHESNGGTPPTFVQRVVSTGSLASEVILAVDVDGDLDTDLISGSTVDDSIVWFDSAGGADPAFTRRGVATDLRVVSALDWVDLNGDGKTDVLSASSGDDKLAWHENIGGSPPAFTTHVIALAEGASGIHAVDLDKDGDKDVLAASFNDDTIAWYENSGGPQPSFTKHVVTTSADGALGVDAVDFDGDLDIDLLVASSNADASHTDAAWWENSGGTPPVFTEHVVSTTSVGARWIGAADIDGDTPREATAPDLDIVVASSGDDTVAWFEKVVTPVTDQPDVISYTKHVITITADFARQAGIADLDTDGDLDLFVVSSGDDSLAWHENQLAATPPIWSEHPVSTNSESARSVAAANVGGDGKLDLVVAFQFGIDWHAGDGEEVCDDFDADGDKRVDGTELVYLGAAFANFCADPGDPAAEWWAEIDVNHDCLVDGDDLSILSGPRVWGKSTDLTPGTDTTNDCSFVCLENAAP